MTDSKFVDDPVPEKTCIVVGTRPGIIKMSPVIDEFQRRSADSFTLHAGQHYSYELDGGIFDDLRLEPPKHRVSGIEEAEFHGEQTAKMLTGIEEILLEEQPENVLVCGDANFNLAGALAARKLHFTVGHVESGLRSDDWRMPEEHNRVMIDHISDHLFAPTEQAKQNAVEDNVKGEVYVTGNTVVDALERNLDIAAQESTIHGDIGVRPEEYVLFTAHREENVDNRETLNELLEVIQLVINDTNLPVLYPVHPRTEKRLKQFGLADRAANIEDLHLIDPLRYLDFIRLLSEAALVLTDSGGVQEESCVMQVPCVTLRENTERPESVSVGANIVAGTNPETVLEAVNQMSGKEKDWENPFGDGKAARRIADAILAG